MNIHKLDNFTIAERNTSTVSTIHWTMDLRMRVTEIASEDVDENEEGQQ